MDIGTGTRKVYLVRIQITKTSGTRKVYFGDGDSPEVALNKYRTASEECISNVET